MVYFTFQRSEGSGGVIGPLFPGEYVASFLSLDKTGEEVETYQQEVTVTEEPLSLGWCSALSD